jgi:hypothetical protein
MEDSQVKVSTVLAALAEYGDMTVYHAAHYCWMLCGDPLSAQRSIATSYSRRTSADGDRIGDAAFRHLLIHTSLFIPVGNNCYIQLSGPPIYDKYEHPRDPGIKRQYTSDERGEEGRKRKKRRKGPAQLASTGESEHSKEANPGSKSITKPSTKKGLRPRYV